MAIIKKSDILEPGKVFAELQKEINDIDKTVKNTTELLKGLQTLTRQINKDGSGAEAKARIELAKSLNLETGNLILQEKKQIETLKKIAIEESNLQKAEQNRIKTEQAQLRLRAQQEQATKRATSEALKLEMAARKLEKAKQEESREYVKQSKLLTELRKKYQDLAFSEKENTTEAKNLLVQITKLDEKFKRVDNIIGLNQRSVGKYSNALKGLGRQLLGAAGITAGFTLFVNVLKNAGKIVVDFEKDTSKLAAILGKTKGDIKGLTDQAKQLGATTAFTASNVVSLQTELAKLGFSLREIEASTPGILDLAAATGTELAPAAELAGATLRIFNLDASEMGRVTDVLAKSTTISSLSMEKLATILPTVDKTAQIAGVSLERTAALAGTLTDRGLDASSAATSLRNIFLELSNQGLTWEQAMIKINTSTDKNKTSMQLFGKRAAAAGVILSETAGATDILVKSLNEAEGAANDMAEAMLDNLGGDITKAKSAWEGFILSVESGDGIISKAVRSIVQSFSSWLTDLTNLNKEHQSFEERLVSWAGVFSALWPGLQGSVKRATAQFKELFGIGKEVEKQKVIGPFDVESMRKQARELQELILSGGKVEKTIEEINVDTKTNTELTAKQIAELKKLKANEAELEAERQKRAAIKAEDEGISFDEVGMAEPTTSVSVNQNATKLAALDKLHADMMISDEKYATDRDNIEIDRLVEQQEKLNELRVEDREKQKEELYTWEDAKNDVREAAWATAEGIAINANRSIANSEINNIKDQNKVTQDLLKDKLQKGQITQAQFDKQSKAANKKARQDEAKATRNAALFDIVISTAVGVIKAIANTGLPAAAPLIVATILLGALNAALVLSQPLPEFGAGEIGIKGNPHSRGGKNINVEGGESIITKAGTEKAPALLSAINEGLVSDNDLPGLVAKGLAFDSTGLSRTQEQGLIASLLMQGNKKTDKMATALLNGVSQYTINGITHIVFADGRHFEQVNNGS